MNEIGIMELMVVIADLIAISLAIVAIIMAINSEKRSRAYFEKIIKIEKALDKKLDNIDKDLDDLLAE